MSKNTTKFKKQSNSSTVIPSIMSVGNKKLVARGDWTEQDKINVRIIPNFIIHSFLNNLKI